MKNGLAIRFKRTRDVDRQWNRHGKLVSFRFGACAPRGSHLRARAVITFHTVLARVSVLRAARDAHTRGSFVWFCCVRSPLHALRAPPHTCCHHLVRCHASVTVACLPWLRGLRAARFHCWFALARVLRVCVRGAHRAPRTAHAVRHVSHAAVGSLSCRCSRCVAFRFSPRAHLPFGYMYTPYDCGCRYATATFSFLRAPRVGSLVIRSHLVCRITRACRRICTRIRICAHAPLPFLAHGLHTRDMRLFILRYRLCVLYGLRARAACIRRAIHSIILFIILLSDMYSCLWDKKSLVWKGRKRTGTDRRTEGQKRTERRKRRDKKRIRKRTRRRKMKADKTTGVAWYLPIDLVAQYSTYNLSHFIDIHLLCLHVLFISSISNLFGLWWTMVFYSVFCIHWYHLLWPTLLFNIILLPYLTYSDDHHTTTVPNIQRKS